MIELNMFMRFIKPPRFEDEEQTRVARILYVIAFATLVGLLVLFIHRILTEQFQNGLPFLVVAIAMGLSILLARRGFVDWSSSLVLWSLFAFLSFQCYEYDGLHDTAVLAIPGLLVVAGLVLKLLEITKVSSMCRAR